MTSDADHNLGILPNAALLAAARSIRGCIRYRQSLDQQLAEAPRMTREFGP